MAERTISPSDCVGQKFDIEALNNSLQKVGAYVIQNGQQFTLVADDTDNGSPAMSAVAGHTGESLAMDDAEKSGTDARILLLDGRLYAIAGDQKVEIQLAGSVTMISR